MADMSPDSQHLATILEQMALRVVMLEEMEMVEQVLDLIKSMLQQGEVVKIAGFGNFVVRNKGERKGRNPRTGEEIAITPRRVVTFRPSQLFKKYVNS